jgi:hypothetical protein
MTEFTLRPLRPDDGPAIHALLVGEAQTTTIAMSTRYRHDVVQALLAQHPSLFGVVATAPDTEGLVGMATAFIRSPLSALAPGERLSPPRRRRPAPRDARTRGR